MELMNEFNLISSPIEAWAVLLGLLFCGGLIGFVLQVIISPRDTYYHGQIDAIRGIIKWKLERNEDGEEVWTEIKEDEINSQDKDWADGFMKGQCM